MELKVDVTCPGCKRTFKQGLRAMRPGGSTTCPHCRASIQFTGDDASKVQRSVDDLNKTIRDLNRKLKL
jgi:hypothetical protein